MKFRSNLFSTEPSSITLVPVPMDRVQVLRDALESWNPKTKSLDDLLLAKLRDDTDIGFFAELLETNLNPVPLRSLLRVVLDRLKANVVVLEHPYLEMEFWDTYAYFHSRSFLDRKKQCWRLHFFRHDPDKHHTEPERKLVDQLYNGAKQQDIEVAGFEYLGFATLRPTTSFCLGRSAVLFDEDPSGGSARSGRDPLDEAGCVAYIKGKGDQIANVCATKLMIHTVPFLQQDPIVGMCATASLWVASQMLASKFDLHKYPYIDISRQATQTTLAPFVAPPPDSNEDFARGLSVPEICGAILRTGAIPLVIVPRLFSDENLGRGHVHDQLYTFVESELPVIICLGRDGDKGKHAVTALGHQQSDVKTIKEISSCTVSAACPKGSPNHYLTSLTARRFYVHNDSYGPFDRLDFIEPSALVGKDGRGYICPVRLSQDENAVFDVKYLVVPVPPYVKNRPDFVLQDACLRFIKLFQDALFDETKLRRKILWRMLLVKGSRFKQSLVEREAPSALIAAYARVHLPKYIWLCEISLFDETNVSRYLGAGQVRKIHGEFIYDTTTAHYTTHAVVQRLGGFFITEPNASSLDREAKSRLMAASLLRGVSLSNEIPCFTGSAQG